MQDTSSTPLSIIGVPIDLGAENLGVGMGADSFRYQSISDKLGSVGFSVTDKGNIPSAERHLVPIGNPKLRRLDEIVSVSERTAKAVHEQITANNKIVVLGGDHSICLGAVAGASVATKGNLGLIYFDAHGDMNTDQTTPTGNIHGMHLASLLGFGAPELINVYDSGAKIHKENLLHIGGSDFDDAELALIRDENLTAFTMQDLLLSNLSPLFQLIDTLSTQVENIWVSLDLDSIDAIYAPGAGMPNQKGLTYREIAAIAEHIGSKGNVIGVDVVEYNPLQDIDAKTAELAIELIATFLGRKYSWYTHYLERNQL